MNMRYKEYNKKITKTDKQAAYDRYLNRIITADSVYKIQRSMVDAEKCIKLSNGEIDKLHDIANFHKEKLR